MTQPLAGVRVADFSHVMAGPFASHLLRLLGAEVIKIESKRGDAFRNYGGDRRFDGMSPAFIAANVGKKSIALDLKDPEEQDNLAGRPMEREMADKLRQALLSIEAPDDQFARLGLS